MTSFIAYYRVSTVNPEATKAGFGFLCNCSGIKPTPGAYGTGWPLVRNYGKKCFITQWS